ncbi:MULTISPECIES: hypothetical protein [Streptomyces]|uniref:hypothetical protein n=1 Tax=Streptomyces TaxID=1883 RepID=UPI00068BBD25|nr:MULTISPECIES: hypothetical protein [Streptomyces]MDP9954207.1 hypothetical protein [Streptomyces sp. DSM 41269]MDP9954253.1 hypothetical protein [Streptomyces sp. DSM 41269]
MVVAEFRDAYPSRGSLYLAIRNYGPSVARDVQVTFQPELPDPLPEKAHESIIPFLKERYAAPITTLTPGTELLNVYYSGVPGSGGKFENWENVPEQVTVTISYTSADKRQQYEDSYALDVELLKNGTSVRSSESLESKTKEISKALQEIAKSTNLLARK